MDYHLNLNLYMFLFVHQMDHTLLRSLLEHQSMRTLYLFL